jgi:hypothetical protein
MKHLGLFGLALSALFLSVPRVTVAQPTANTSEEIAIADPKEAFDKLKTLEGSWVGPLTTDPAEPSVAGAFAQLSLQVTSRGNAFVHELSVSGLPDHPVTVFYIEDDNFVATHYCDSGNRPRLINRVSPDGNTVEFEFGELSGTDQYGHMHGAVFTFIDENHHTEEWTWMLPDGKTVRMRLDLQRTNFESATPSS